MQCLNSRLKMTQEERNSDSRIPLVGGVSTDANNLLVGEELDEPGLAPNTALIPAVHNIPNEILASIFDECEPPDMKSIPSTTIAYCVSRVCRRWREVAIHCPSIWNAFVIHDRRNVQQMTSLHLTRSREFPLDIILMCDGPQDQITLTLDLLVAHAHRWRRFSAITSSKNTMTLIIHRFQLISAPCLRILDLRLSRILVNNAFHVSPIFSAGCPLLSILRIHGMGFNWASFPVRSLTELDLRYLTHQAELTWNEFRNMIAASPSLQRLRIIGAPIIPPDPRSIITIPSLLSLVLCKLPYWAIIDICSALSTPALESLTIVSVGFIGNPHMLCIDMSRLPKYPFLRFLHICGIEFLVPMDVLSLPMLSSLILHTHAETTNMFLSLLKGQAEAVVTGSDTHLLCPNLRSITLTPEGYDEGLLRDMLSARLSIGAPVENLNWQPCEYDPYMGVYRETLDHLA